MRYETFQAFSDELHKIASTRMEKEVRKGTIRRSAVVPGVLDSPDGVTGAVGRKAARNKLIEQTRSTPEALARHRRMNELLYKNQMAHPEQAMNIRGLTADTRAIPMMGPATVGGFGGPSMSVPETSGTFIRSMGEGSIGQVRAIAGTVPNTSFLAPKAQPSDVTSRLAVLRHEGGEAYHIGSGQDLAPHSSHIGMRPQLEERMATRLDPEAGKAFSNVRKIHSDDALAGRLIRQAGGTPDSPLPIGGRAERSLGKMLARRVRDISPDARAKAMMMASSGAKIPYVPQGVAENFRTLPSQLQQLGREAKTLSVRNAVRTGKGILSGIGRMSKFVYRGR